MHALMSNTGPKLNWPQIKNKMDINSLHASGGHICPGIAFANSLDPVQFLKHDI